MFNKFELIGAGVSVFLMALAIYLTQAESILFRSISEEQSAKLISSQEAGVVIVDNYSNGASNGLGEALLAASDDRGNLNSMVINDVKIGTGDEVQKGDVVSVHYVGTLQNGQEFDNSRKRGEAFEFKVGKGQVIEGWDKGVLGMKMGGQRILVIPSEMAYGSQGVGPIPGGATLVFAIELLEIK